MSRRRLSLPFAVDLRRSLRPLRLGKHDPTIDLRADVGRALSLSTPDGAAVGPRAPRRRRHRGRGLGRRRRVGPRREPRAVRPARRSGRVRSAGRASCGRLHRDGDGLRLPRTGILLDALVPAILSQRVTGFEAKRSYRTLVERWGEPAPGPGRAAPDPARRADRRARLLRPARDRRGEGAGRHPQASLRPRRPGSQRLVTEEPGRAPRPGSRASRASAPGPPPRWPAWSSGMPTP